MSENAYKAFVPFASGVVDQDEPVGIDVFRVMLENALFAQESAGQVRVRLGPLSTSHELSTQTTVVADEYHLVWRDEIDVHMHPNGGAFRFRVSLAGRSSQGDQVTWRLAIGHPRSVAAQAVASTVGDNVAEYTVSSMTAGWLTATGSKTLLEIPSTIGVADEAMAAVVFQDSIAAVGSSVRTTVPVCRLDVQVWAKVDSVASIPSLAGVLVQEYIGT